MGAAFDAFELLELPRRLVLGEEQIKEAYRVRAGGEHPDREAGDSGRFDRLTRARATLLSPARRLRHWLELEGEGDEFQSHGTVSADLMDLFARVAELLQRADQALAARENALSTLAKAMQESTIGEVRDEIETLQEQVIAALASECEKFDWFEREGPQACAEEITTCCRNLAFLEKWQAQLRERYGRCF